MSREKVLKSLHWKVSYTYACSCQPRCHWTEIRGRHNNRLGIFLVPGKELLGAEAAAAHIAQQHDHRNISDIRMWQESTAERDARLVQLRREEAQEARGIHWAMGGAN
ncbi:hypothetical protein [Streptomyces noursei]|uniref:hypothetical protein n=1 Tax=Streptomyces noursei TaxID=1971 RepID=UPI0030F34D45